MPCSKARILKGETASIMKGLNRHLQPGIMIIAGKSIASCFYRTMVKVPREFCCTDSRVVMPGFRRRLRFT